MDFRPIGICASGFRSGVLVRQGDDAGAYGDEPVSLERANGLFVEGGESVRRP